MVVGLKSVVMGMMMEGGAKRMVVTPEPQLQWEFIDMNSVL